MGIAGLLPLLRSITKRVHIESLAGQSVAVDAYSWLHKGVYLCAHDLFHQRPTNGYVEYCISKIRLLTLYNIKPILVFDGAPLPMKAGKETSRHQYHPFDALKGKLSIFTFRSREDSRNKANELIGKGDHKAATAQIHKSIDVTPEMAYALIQELKLLGIDYVVAPYEADAQMAFLDRIGKVAAIITEDSDMLLFGCKKMLYKLDKHGYADEINLEHIGETTDIELSGFTLERFRQMCILSGCDYLEAISGFGLKTCHKYFVKYKTLDRVLQAVRAEYPSKIPDDFERKFKMAELTFSHQRVYDHRCQELVHLYPITEDMILSEEVQDYGNWDFVGPHVESSIAKGVARGELHPVTKLPFQTAQQEDSLQDSLDSQKALKNPVHGKVVKSRFFQPISKEHHQTLTAQRLTIRASPYPSSKENDAPLRVASQSRGISTFARKRPAPSNTTMEQDYSTPKVPNILCIQKKSSFSSKTGASKTKPVRLDSVQSSLLHFLKRT